MIRILSTTPQGGTLIERAGRVCYRSHDRMNEGTAPRFIAGIIQRGHESVIEHWRALFEVEADPSEMLELLLSSPLLVATRRENRFLLSGNARMLRSARGPLAEELQSQAGNVSPVLFGGDTMEPPAPFLDRTDGNVALWSLFAPEGLAEEELFRHGAATVYLTEVSRTLTHQLVRHRMASYSQASQRYCNEEKFEVVTPPSIEAAGAASLYRDAVEALRPAYLALKQHGVKGEDARYLLPGGTHSEIVVTMTFEHWANFFALRCDRHAQWEIREAAERIRNLFHEALPALEKRL